MSSVSLDAPEHYPETTDEPSRGVPEHVALRLGSGVNMSDDDEKALAIESLSNAQLIQILQQDDSDENEPNSITRIVEAEIARRKKEGPPQQ
jgi:hypothetical protein